MNEPTNAPMLPPPSGVSEWVSTWREALTRPSDLTFARIAQSPNAKLTTALLWVFLGSLVSALLAVPVQGPLMQQILQNSGLEGQGFSPAAGGGFLTALCGAPVWAVIQVVFFAIGVGIIQLLARLFGGRGSYDQMTYTLAAIVTPFYFVSGVLTLLSAIPFAGFCFSILALFLGLYVLVLEIMAVKGVNQFGWGQALGSVLLPVFAVLCCVVLGFVGLFQALGPEGMDIFNSILTPPAP